MPTLDSIDIHDARLYVERGYPWQGWDLLRREAPVYWYEREDIEPFWAITRHADIVSISRQPERFLNAPRLTVTSEAEGTELPVHMLLNMDPPKHHEYRSLVNKHFTPRAMKSIASRVDTIATEILDAACPGGEETEFDFVEEISARLPIWVIAEMLGVPYEDRQKLFEWSNRMVGSEDPEYLVDESEVMNAQVEMFMYAQQLAADRRENPRDDIVSTLLFSEIDGDTLSEMDFNLFFMLLSVAGNETTRNATSGGMLAFIEHPEELRKLQNDPSLLKPAVEEVLRWSSPLIHFARTATEDYELRGRTIRRGDVVSLFYPSANRDEDVFDDPFTFRIDRDPNLHVGFGVGEHLCMGAHVARAELKALFGRLLARMESVELAGEVKRLRSSFVGGIKHMPVRYRVAAA